jgi:hypothetical protein
MKTKPKGVTWNDGSHTLTLDDGTTITAERLCVATGRKPRTADLGLESAGVTLDDDGAITIDETCRAAGGIYAIGDVTNIAPLTHVAKYQARIAAATILGSHAKARYDAVPRCVYTAPEFAAVGITRKGAAERASSYSQRRSRSMKSRAPRSTATRRPTAPSNSSPMQNTQAHLRLDDQPNCERNDRLYYQRHHRRHPARNTPRRDPALPNLQRSLLRRLRSPHADVKEDRGDLGVGDDRFRKCGDVVGDRFADGFDRKAATDERVEPR